jgi:predicted NBD/HSP70 family sugar kinase
VSAIANTYSGRPLVREEGAARLIRAIHRHGLEHANGWLDNKFAGMAPADAAALTQLSRPSVSIIAKRLREEGVLERKPSGLLFAPRRAPVACGVDIGFSQIRVALSDIHGQLLKTRPEERKPSSLGEDAEGALEWIVTALQRLLEEAHETAPGTEPLGVTISIPGPLDPNTGKIKDTWHSGGDWRFLSARDELRERLDWNCPITISRDANASAIAEAIWGASRGINDVLYVKWSEDGVSASLTLAHQLFAGADGVAGEIGHALVQPHDSDPDSLKKWLEGHVCVGCNRRGCLATVASLDALREYIGDAALTAENLLQLARGRGPENGSERSRKAREGLMFAARCMGRVLSPVVEVLNPQAVIIGGKIGARAYSSVAPELNKSLKRGATTPAIEAVETVSGTPALTGQTSVRGAIALALVQHADERLLSDRTLAIQQKHHAVFSE